MFYILWKLDAEDVQVFAIVDSSGTISWDRRRLLATGIPFSRVFKLAIQECALFEKQIM